MRWISWLDIAQGAVLDQSLKVLFRSYQFTCQPEISGTARADGLEKFSDLKELKALPDEDGIEQPNQTKINKSRF